MDVAVLSVPPINDRVNVASVGSELPVNRRTRVVPDGREIDSAYLLSQN
jgi:hypothetical protein